MCLVIYVGDPSLDAKVERVAVVSASVKARRRNQLALNLLDILFDPMTSAESKVSGSRDGSKKALDPTKIEAITRVRGCSDSRQNAQ